MSWDALVVGAGPAGAMAARELAGRGLATLLVDRREFPRSKVCGACLNRRSLSLLAGSGLAARLRISGGVPLRRMRLAAGGEAAVLPTPEGLALSRARLDAELVAAARAAGANFADGTRATLGRCGLAGREVWLDGLDGRRRVEARVVVAADGLGGSLVPGSARRARVARRSRIGVGATLPPGAIELAAGEILMAVGRRGYVGVVEVEGGAINAAAALDREALVGCGGIVGAVGEVLQEAGVQVRLDLAELDWKGTAPLTRRPVRRAGERLFRVGDAAGYVEPFTGEGMAWALESARAVAPLAARGAEAWSPLLARRWERLYASRFGRRQRLCRAVALGLRQPRLVATAARILGRSPALAAPFVRRVNAAVKGAEA